MTLKNISSEHLRNIILTLIESKLSQKGLLPEKLSNDTDLLQSGILDSFDFINLICSLEDEYELCVDIEGMEDLEFTKLSGFMQGIIEQNS